MKALLMCAMLVAIPAAAEADEWIIFGQEELGGILTSSEILLKNRSRSRLFFYASDGAEPWTKFYIEKDDTALIKRSRIVIAISTSRSATDPEAEAPPQIPPDEATKDTVSGQPTEVGVYTISYFTGGQRAEFCWNKNRQRWMILAQGSSCN